jgi:hypothetical protein
MMHVGYGTGERMVLGGEVKVLLTECAWTALPLQQPGLGF